MAALIGMAMFMAQEIPADTLVTAIRVGLDPQMVHEATVTVGTDAVSYLTAEGVLPRPSEPPALAQPAAPAAQAYRPVWDRLAACESTSNWRANTGNGYYGGLQEDMVFWRNYGGLEFAARPDLASRSAQILVAERGLARQGWGAWPACSRRLGLR